MTNHCTPLFLALLASACHTGASVPPVTSSHAETAPTSQPCTAEATEPAVVAMRPHSGERFGQLDPGTSVEITARSRDGWLGFDPGVAQAANVGPFRLRWVEPSQVVTRGDCARVPEVWAPPPGVCFEMPMEDAIVREAPRADATAVLTLHAGDFAALVERGQEWAKIDLGAGNTGSHAIGWIETSQVNMNGSCDNIEKR